MLVKDQEAIGMKPNDAFVNCIVLPLSLNTCDLGLASSEILIF